MRQSARWYRRGRYLYPSWLRISHCGRAADKFSSASIHAPDAGVRIWKKGIGHASLSPCCRAEIQVLFLRRLYVCGVEMWALASSPVRPPIEVTGSLRSYTDLRNRGET